MRNHVINKIEELAKDNEKIFIITGDLGFGVLDSFQAKFPDRFINAGICEQNMTAMAAGLALEKNIVYTYSIGNFPVMRCLEQIRNDICYHNANVKIIVIGGGFAYGQLGMSHHATEDIAITRALPNLNIYSPADSIEAIKVIEKVNTLEKPCYIRLGKGKEPILHENIVQFEIEKLLEIYSGENIAIISTGSIGIEAKKAVEELHFLGYKIGFYNAISLKPFDAETLKSMALNYKIIITLEEHNVIGGLGSIVSDVITENNLNIKLLKMGLKDEYTTIVGTQEYLREFYKLSKDYVVKKVLENMPK